MRLTNEQLKTAISLASQGKPIQYIRESIGATFDQFNEALSIDPQFKREFLEARQAGWDELADALIDIADKHTDLFRARLASDNIKWILSKRKPDTYGDRVDVNVKHTVDISTALNEARARALIPMRYLDDTQSIQHTDMIKVCDIDTTDYKTVEKKVLTQRNIFDSLNSDATEISTSLNMADFQDIEDLL